VYSMLISMPLHFSLKMEALSSSGTVVSHRTTTLCHDAKDFDMKMTSSFTGVPCVFVNIRADILTPVHFCPQLAKHIFVCIYTRVYPKVSGLAAWSENCKLYSSLPLDAVVSLLCEPV
jgi:hypothetical protein